MGTTPQGGGDGGGAAAPPPPFSRWGVWAVAVGWTALVGCLLALNLQAKRAQLTDLATTHARAAVDKDLAYRRWAAGHGGVYVPATAETPPNPYLLGLPERDIPTPSGRQLTLVNPAYMTRQVHELEAGAYGLRGHITSLTPLRPENAPDPWEATALTQVSATVPEYSEVADLDGRPHLRLMRVIVTEPSCLKCHAAQGYRVGQVRGGLSTAIPLAPYWAAADPSRRLLVLGYLLVWALGLVGLHLGQRRVQRGIGERDRALAALHESEARYRAALEAVPDLMFRLSRDGTHVDYHAHADAALYVRPEAFLGRRVEEALPGPVATAYRLHIDRALAERRTQTLVYSLEFGPGDRRDYEARLTPCGEDDVLAVVREVTERRRAEEELAAHRAQLAEANQMLTRVLGHTHMLAALLDADFNYLWVNRAFADDGRHPEAFFAGRNHLELYPGPDNAAVFRRVRASGEAHYALAEPFEYADQPERGVTYWDWSLVPVHDATGAVSALVLTLADVTERERTEAALRDSEARHRAILETAMDGFWVVDANGRLVEVNETYCRMSGYSQRELLGMCVSDLEASESADQTAAHIARIRTAGEDRFESCHRRRDGSQFDIEVSVQCQLHRGGQMVVFVRDITQRKQLERELAAQRLQLLQADRLHALGEMAAGVAHEINQPLNGIRAFAEGALLGLERGWSCTSAEVRGTLTDIVAQVDRATVIIDHMRAFGRDPAQQSPVSFALGDVVQGALTLLGAQLRLHGVTVETRLAADLPRCHGWPQQLEQVLLNLLSNARDALTTRRDEHRLGQAPEGWRAKVVVTTTAGPEANEVSLCVDDNGGGMEPAVADRVFEPFYTTKDVGQGTGLGLAIARSLVERHAGRIDMQNRPGDGVGFRVVLPGRG